MSRGAGTPPEEAPVLTTLGGTSSRMGSVEGHRERRLLPDRRILPARVLTLASQRRRRGGPVTREALTEFARFLMTRPVGDRIAQYVVTRLMSVHGARGSVISRFGTDGTLAIVGSFGMSEEALSSCGSLSLWDSSPMSDAAISGEPVILLTPAEVDEEYPASAEEAIPVRAPVACWPLALPQQSLGAMQLTLPSSSAAQTLLADGAEVAVLLSLYLSLAGPLPPTRPSHLESVVGEPMLGTATVNRRTPEDLTERQTAILVRMAAGQTNAQIARDIGFSESTVRQETMAIYRCLGATGRHDATRLAAERGMTLGN